MAFQHRTWLIPPPAEKITPAIARQWLHRSYPPLAKLTSMIAHPGEIPWHGTGLDLIGRAHALWGLKVIASDVRRTTVACGKALATGRAVPMVLEYPPKVLSVDHRRNARAMRAVLKYERRRPHRGARRILQRALAEQERLVRGEK